MTTPFLGWEPDGGGILGTSTLRSEDHRLLTGQGSFVSDLIDPDTLHIGFVRSPVPHGTITSLAVDDAESMPGVIRVVTGDSLELEAIPAPALFRRSDLTRPLLASQVVRYVGEPIVAVVAESPSQLQDAIDAIWVDLDEMPPTMAPTADEPGDPLFVEGNLLSRELLRGPNRVTGDMPISVTIEVANQRLAPVAIEGLAIICEPDPAGRLTVTCSHQTAHRLRDELAAVLHLNRSEIRVVVPDVGGAFGLKGMFFTEYAVTCAMAMELNRPVAWEERRREHLTAGTHGRGSHHVVTLEGDRSGRIRRAQFEISLDVGAYPHSSAPLPSLMRAVAAGLYDIEDVQVWTNVLVSNKAPIGSYRGAGRPEAAYAIERAIDAFARKAGLDPVEVRRRNLIHQSALPYRTQTGSVYDSGHYRAALDMAMGLVGETRLRAEQQRRLDAGENPIGMGVGAFIESAGGIALQGEYGSVAIVESGDIVIRTGSVAAGQGHATVWSQIAADVFDVDPSRVRVVAGDTDEVGDGVGTYASRSAQVGASAAYRMAVSVQKQAARLAADLLEASPADIEVHQGSFRVVGVPGSELSLAELARRARDRHSSLSDSEMFNPRAQTFPYGVHVAVLEVDLTTGLVKLLQMVAVDDCGNVLNPMIVDGQLQGSLVQGIGQALLEGVEYDEDGHPLTGTMLDYRIPAASDVPPIVTERLTHPAPSNPLGVKGTGEAGCIGAPPAIVNAALDALAPYGVTDLDMPLRPDRVWEAIQAGRA